MKHKSITNQKTALIIGAGPAGLTAAYELLQQSDIKPLVFEMSEDIGGISKTVNYKGNRIDIGGHRFFSKSDRVMQWWLNILPIQKIDNNELEISYQNKNRQIGVDGNAPDPDETDQVFLVRHRLSRIFYLRHFFDYPLTISMKTIRGLGLLRIVKVGFSYFRAMLFPVKPEITLEDFFINRFGRELYATFFRDYTEKVWGVACTEIGADWGAQRIKGLSITRALIHAFKNLFVTEKGLDQKNTETSLIERFLYPKFGPGQIWESVAERVRQKGGEVNTGWQVRSFGRQDDALQTVELVSTRTGETRQVAVDYVFSTMPVRELVAGLPDVPARVREVAQGLKYRDFMTAGLLVKKLCLQDCSEGLQDNWIYIQEPDVRVGRIQIFNNWSPYMVADPETVWMGLEYFCNDDDDLWGLSDREFTELAIAEMVKLGFVRADDILDSTVIRQPKAYPAYFGSYRDFDIVRNYLDTIENLFLIGRNGMHKYNNQDHSMLTAMQAVENIVQGVTDKSNIWAVNTEQEYHESK